MRIEELVIEGFKSYPVRTQIVGWDPSFNAITGLNGSGKSNILDAICFVLGITNMSQMRAANQQDLIYKRGQAGVTRASVTIVFDNSDRSQSPSGYEQFKQITVTRQIALPNVSKYLLNGHKALQANIQVLFQSVQLNINNPNFVIMQGRITKVLNMRPQEILGMVEEAAGTRMFEDRKDKATKTMGKKEKRVQELRDILDTEISPKLEKLRSEKRSYMQYQKAQIELEHVARKLHAFEWKEFKARAKAKQGEIDEEKEEIKRLEGEIKEAQKHIAETEKKKNAVEKQRDAESKKGGKLKKLQDEVTAIGLVLARETAKVDIHVKSIKDEEAKVTHLEAQLKETEAAFVSRQKEVAKVEAAFAKVKDKQTAFTTKLASDEELLQTLLTGLSSSDAKNKGGGYMGQLADARARIAQAAAAEEQNRVKLGMSEKELGELEGRMRTLAKEAGDNVKKLESLKAMVGKIENALAGTGWTAEKDKELDMQLRQARDEVKQLTEQRDRVRSRIPRLAFDYDDPTPGFDRRKVHGVAAQLITLPQEHHDKSVALEIAGGGKLFNVVISDEQVGKDLIKNGHMRRRVTFIPLSKITAWTLADHKLAAAKRLAPNKVRTALSLVGSAPAVQKAVAYIFGDTLICDDAESAKAVTFAREVSARSVTLQGDVYDPSGTLSGGAPPNSSNVLVQVQELLAVEERLHAARTHLDGLLREEEKSKGVRETWRALGRDMEIRAHELKLLQEQVGGSSAALNATAVEQAKATIQALRDAVQAAKDAQKEAKAECTKLERDMDEFKNNKDGKIDELKASISAQKAAHQKHNVVLKTQQKELQSATLELDQLEGDIAGEKAKMEEAEGAIADMRAELEELQAQVAASEAKHKNLEEKLAEERATLTRFDTELAELDREIKETKAAAADSELQAQEATQRTETLGKERTNLLALGKRHEQSYPWILEDKGQFGLPDTQYDFTGIDADVLKNKCDELEASTKGMKKKINPKVMSMIDSVEKKEVELKKNMATVEKDKLKIEETIAELDRYKREALEKTWGKVTTDFGDIFAELLPGNFAKLVVPEGQDLMDGLEVKVRLGTVWKQSLTELSGGQRSLIALSLIMALLQFKPAPMYILDEIDAALDLSHTQHIGQLFRTRFKGSQFIVVSLKEGLFTNANVLFRARFRDGTSVVERTAQRSTSALYTNGGGEEDEENRNPRRARRVAGS